MVFANRDGRRRRWLVGACVGLTLAGALPGPATAVTSPAVRPASGPRACPPSGKALSFSDALDKLDVGGVRVGGLSSLAYDSRRKAWASAVDNHESDPSRIWFFRDLAAPRVIGTPLVLRRPDGTAYDGTTADNEGLAVLHDGRFLVSSETEPSVRVYGRDGVQRASLPVPARFAVTGTTTKGEATANATLEGLTVTPDGRSAVAAMEGALSGDVAADGDATWHRFLLYRNGHRGWGLDKQLAYRADPGQRVAEVAAVGSTDLLVLEASFAPATGNQVRLYLVRGFRHARDVSRVADLSATAPRIARKQLLADLVECPTLGAPTKQPEANPLLDNFEGLAVTSRVRRRHPDSVRVSLISDDNFSASQTTRVLNLSLRLRR